MIVTKEDFVPLQSFFVLADRSEVISSELQKKYISANTDEEVLDRSEVISSLSDININ
jgi:hypothetical protein